MTDSIIQDDSVPSPPIAEDWETDEGAEDVMHKQLEEKLKQVRILQREKADKNSMIERAKQEEEQSSSVPDLSVPVVVFQPPLKMQILQRPKGSEDPNAKKTDANAKVKPTLEERQAAYDEARNRILGSNYKPETAANPVTASVSSNSRNKSPEQIRVRRPSPEFLMSMLPPHGMQSNASAPSLYGNYVASMQVTHHAQPYHMAAQGFVPYIDTSRPPPQTPPQVPLSNACGGLSQNGAYAPMPSIAHYPPTGQYYTVMPTPVPQPVPFGAPPVALYPPGTLGSIMQFNTTAPGQTSSQRKNKNKKKPGSVQQAAQQTA